MFDALFIRFDMAVEHRRVGVEPDLMRGARDIDPWLAADFVVADRFAHAGIENFGAPAGERIHTCIFERQERIADGKPGNTREIANLDHGKSLQVHAGAARLKATNQVEKISE